MAGSIFPRSTARVAGTVSTRVRIPAWPHGRRLLAQSCIKCDRLAAPEEFREGRNVCVECRPRQVSAEKQKEYTTRYWDGRVRRNRPRDLMQEINRQYAANAKNNGKQWTSAELTLVVRGDLTIRQLSERLGRTYFAVRNARRRAAIDPRFASMAETADRWCNS